MQALTCIKRDASVLKLHCGFTLQHIKKLTRMRVKMTDFTSTSRYLLFNHRQGVVDHSARERLGLD